MEAGSLSGSWIHALGHGKYKQKNENRIGCFIQWIPLRFGI